MVNDIMLNFRWWCQNKVMGGGGERNAEFRVIL